VTGRERTSGFGLRASGLGRAEARCAKAGGFTLIELLIVVTLIIVLAGIALATYTTSVTRAKEATLKEDLFRLNDAIDQYNADKGHEPADLASLVTDGYIRRIPVDPFTKSADTWQTIMGEADPSNPSAVPGVHEVRSGAEGTGLEGTPYSEW
jgi:general secretion pathway protein G